MAATRWGILGAGRICHDFVTAFADWAPNTQNNVIVAVAARDLQRAKDFAAKHKIDKAYGSYEELAKDHEIDVIYMGNIHTQHLGVGKMCLDHGKHLLVEKPLTTCYKDSKELIDYAKSKKLFLMEAVWTRCFPATAFLKEKLAAVAIGELKYLSARFCVNIKPREPHPDHGSHLDVGVYVLHTALNVFGEEPVETSITRVTDENDVIQSVSYTLKFRNGGIAQLMAAFNFRAQNWVYLVGTKGTIEIPDYMWSPSEVIVNGEKHEFPLPKHNDADYNYPRGVGLFYEVLRVADCIKQGLLECPLVPHHDTLIAAKINDQATA